MAIYTMDVIESFKHLYIEAMFARQKSVAYKCLYWLSRIRTDFQTLSLLKWREKAERIFRFAVNNRLFTTALPYERGTADYHNWRIDCLNRDDWVCQDCRATKELHVHHIKTYKNHIELRLDLNNGITLCKKCHRGRHKDNE